MSVAGIPLSVIDDETGWISVIAGRRALAAIEDALGAGVLTRLDTWLTHPENLGTYVRMLRTASKPLDAYRFLAQYPDQASRLGSYELTEISPLSVRMAYRLRDDSETSHRHRLFCDAREGELSSLPHFWGLTDATVVHEACLHKGDPTCTYLVTWKHFIALESVPRRRTGAAISAGSVALSGGRLAMGIAAGIGATLGGVIGALSTGSTAIVPPERSTSTASPRSSAGFP
jgi:hypothetical protein